MANHWELDMVDGMTRQSQRWSKTILYIVPSLLIRRKSTKEIMNKILERYTSLKEETTTLEATIDKAAEDEGLKRNWKVFEPALKLWILHPMHWKMLW